MPRTPFLHRLTLALLFAAVAMPLHAQTVTFNGSLGSTKALLIIDGTPRTLAVGESYQGVKLLSLGAEQAQVDIGGRRVPLLIGAAPVSLGAAARDGAGSQIVLTAGLGGHFIAGGSINGRAVQFMVDTGATTVAIGQADAARIGIDLRSAQRFVANTANGAVPVHRVMLNSIRMGDVEVYNVEAIVMPVSMDQVLLGNSYLTRFQMKRENDRMTLDKRN